MGDEAEDAKELTLVDYLDDAVHSLESALRSVDSDTVVVNQTTGDGSIGELHQIHETLFSLYQQLAAFRGSEEDYKNVAYTALELGDFFSNRDIAAPYYRQARDALQCIPDERQDVEYLNLFCYTELSLGEVESENFDTPKSMEHLERAFKVATSLVKMPLDPDEQHTVGKTLLLYAERHDRYMHAKDDRVDIEDTVRTAQQLLIKSAQDLHCPATYYYAGLATYFIAEHAPHNEKGALITEAITYLDKSYHLDQNEKTAHAIKEIRERSEWFME